jgi:hypothetical protein
MKSSEKSPIAYIETKEQKRLNETRETGIPWKKWGPYLSERQWFFYEYFHGDSGAGLGASHQTGWTGTIARTLDLFARLKPGDMLKTAKSDLMAEITRQQVAG